MRFVIITRIGLGRRDDAFYREHMDLLALTLAPSLLAQTSKDFSFVPVIDARAPEWVDRAIADLLPGVDVDIWRLDPLVTGLNPVDKNRLIAMADDYPIITSRVDDDDLLHVSFIEAARAALASAAPTTYLTFPSGLGLSADGAAPMRKPWIGLGLSCLTTPAIEGHGYRYSHTKSATLASADGHDAIVVETDGPMWARTYRSSSDSVEAKGVTLAGDVGDHFQPRDFGLSVSAYAQLRQHLTSATTAPARAGLTTKAPLPRLHMKLQIIRRVLELRKTPGASADEIEALANAFYAL